MIRAKKFLPRRSRKSPKILIAGLGNLLLRDDGVGVQAVRGLQKNPPAGVMVVEVGTAILDALHLFEWADRVLGVDAMQAGGPAGTVYSLSVSDVEDQRPQGSLHELNLLAALRFLRNGRRPAILILGVEPEIIDFGLELSSKVAAALPVVIHSVREIVNSWRGGPRQPKTAGYPGPLKVLETCLEGRRAAGGG
jgi:hydrogenase maturation protease